jgi:hypothetical protein
MIATLCPFLIVIFISLRIGCLSNSRNTFSNSIFASNPSLISPVLLLSTISNTSLILLIELSARVRLLNMKLRESTGNMSKDTNLPV